MGALSHLRICDFTGQLAGAGATRTLAAFGAQVIRIADPVTQGRWDILGGMAPFVDDRRGIQLGGGFQNHNVEKLGITLNLRTDRGCALRPQLVASSDVVAEDFGRRRAGATRFPIKGFIRDFEATAGVTASAIGRVVLLRSRLRIPGAPRGATPCRTLSSMMVARGSVGTSRQ